MRRIAGNPPPSGRDRVAATSRRKRLFLAAFTIGFPLLFFLAVDGALRVVGFGSDYPLFVPADGSGVHLRMNPDVGHRFFSRDIALPGVTRDLFLADKPEDGYRIIVQGASTALGYPYFYGGAFPRMIERRLEATFPDRRIEVVNTAMVAVNSYTLLDFADEIVEARPDAVLIYAGHNEYYGLMGVASSQRVGGSRTAVRGWLRLRRWRIAQLVQSGIDRVRQRAQPASSVGAERDRTWSSWSDMVPFGSTLYERGLAQFRANLNDLLERYRRAGVPVFLATIVSNDRDQSPFVSTPDTAIDAVAWEEAVRNAIAESEAGDAAAARGRLQALMQRDSMNADAFFDAARRFDRAGAPELARGLYAGARDRDHLRFRAPHDMNVIIREAEHREGVTLVDVEAVFTRASPDGIVGANLLNDHVHPRLEGYSLIADAFTGALRTAGEIEPAEPAVSGDEARSNLPYTAVDSLYGELLLGAMTSRWPFDPEEAAGRALSVGRPDDAVLAIAEALYRGDMVWPQAMQALFDHYYQNAAYESARHVARSLAQEYPDLATPLVMWGLASIGGGDASDAVAATRGAHEIAPSHHTALMRGSALLAAGERDEALRYLEAAVGEAPPEEAGPAAALRAARALPSLERAAAEHPGSADALVALADACAAVYQAGRAWSLVEEVLEMAPSHTEAIKLRDRLAGGHAS